ncbi:hypothetical protein [Aeromonas veronii]|uniref:hypothetical protein n=1 Tax=Aeromonas veronii TaxID=654 RepID=UPI001119A9BA|nr:hypothetical protein [Aeromonas veronii]EKP0295036.1 hypothetical protein [Aeromonas veronii]MCX0423900.1 hypothetical protein [Aeromonas veronii]WIJ39985.1 hypothetical protein QPK06_12905 [Aeromonas veronii]
MIYERSKFEKASRSNAAKVAALPQDSETWCLAIKVGASTAYLGDSTGQDAREFSSLDELINYAHQNLIGEVLVITGAKSWRF